MVAFAEALPADQVTALGLLAQKPSRDLWRSLSRLVTDDRLREIAGLLVRHFEADSLSEEEQRKVDEFLREMAVP